MFIITFNGNKIRRKKNPKKQQRLKKYKQLQT